MPRLGVWVTHPIQYYAPWFRYLAERMRIEVFYAHGEDKRSQANAGFGVEFNWDVPVLEGYPYRWLRNVAKNPRLGAFRGLDTPDIYSIVRREHFDAFLVFGWNRKSALQTIHACRRNGVPVLMRGDSQLRNARPLKTLAKCLPYRWFLPRLNGHLYVGAKNMEYLKHYGVREDRLFFSPHFVDNSFFSQHARDARSSQKDLRIRESLGIELESFVVLFVGKFLPIKRVADVINACSLVPSFGKCVDVHVILVGDGPMRTEVERLAGNCRQVSVHLVGFRNQRELPAFYSAADALVLSSNSETWGLVVNEAMACGVPAIVSQGVGCAPDLIDEGSTGYTYPVGDVDTLARRILTLIADRENRPATMREALARKMKCYSMQRATEGLRAALEAVCESN